MLKIAIVGPESTGKSKLSAYLAEAFNCLWVPEYARIYCENMQVDCTLEDEIAIFNGQLHLEEEYLQRAELRSDKLLFCDTTIMNVKVWCEHVFQICPTVVEQEYQSRAYDFYLLCKPDIPWEDDPLRNFPEQRDFFFNWYRKLLDQKQANYALVSGMDQARFENAENLVKQFLNKEN